MPDVYPVFPEYDIELQAKCMNLVRAHTDVPVPDVRWVELDAAVARDAVPRDAPHRRRSAPGHPAVRVRRLGRRRAGGDTCRDADAHAGTAEEAARAHARERRPGIPHAAPARIDRVAAAGRARAVVLRLGARRPLVPAHRRDVRVARRALARRGRDGPQLGRRAGRQHLVPRLHPDRGARLGDGNGRAARSRPRMDDLPARVLPRHGRSDSGCRG